MENKMTQEPKLLSAEDIKFVTTLVNVENDAADTFTYRALLSHIAAQDALLREAREIMRHAERVIAKKGVYTWGDVEPLEDFLARTEYLEGK